MYDGEVYAPNEVAYAPQASYPQNVYKPAPAPLAPAPYVPAPTPIAPAPYNSAPLAPAPYKPAPTPAPVTYTTTTPYTAPTTTGKSNF